METGKDIMELFQRGYAKDDVRLNVSFHGEREEEHELSSVWKEGMDLAGIESAGGDFVDIMTRTNKNLMEQAVSEWSKRHLEAAGEEKPYGRELQTLLLGLFKAARPLFKMYK